MNKDIRQSKEYAEFLKKIGWKVEKIDNFQIFIKKIPILGNAIKLQRTEKVPFEKLQQFAKNNNAFLIIIEPFYVNNQFFNNSFKLSNSPYLPTKTLQINLKESENKILSNMKKDARYALRKTENFKLIKEKSLTDFRTAWKNAVGNKRHVLPINELNAFKKSFGKHMLLLLNKEKTSGGMFLLTNKTCYYWAGFTDKSARKYLVQYQVIWSALKWAKKNGATIFDFEGIYDPRFPKKDWIGFTHFKKSFGGVEIEYPGAYTKQLGIWKFLKIS